MKRRGARRRVVAVASVATLLFASPLASAFCRTMVCKDGACPLDDSGCPTSGVLAAWSQSMPLTFRFQARGTALLINEEARAAVRAAFFRWTDVQCDGRRTSLRFVEGEEIFEDKPLTEDGKVTDAVSPFGIFFRDTGWPHRAQNGDGVIALTTLVAGVTTGRITYADIELNTGGQSLTTTGASHDGLDLQTVMTHEVGHYIGLAHSRANHSIMSANLCDSGQRCEVDKIAGRRLADDDRAAVCALYPPDAPARASAPPADGEGGCSTSPSSSDRGSAMVLLALVLIARPRRR